MDDDDWMLCSARLRSCLPQMVIDVLEEKMEHEYHAGAVSLLRHINDAPLLSKEYPEPDDAGDDFDDGDGGGEGILTSTCVSSFSVFMAALWNIFALWFLLSSFFFFSSPNLSGHRHICFTPSSIGWMFLSASSLSSEWPFIGVCGAMLLSTLSTAASPQPMRPVASGSVQQVAISSSCHDIVSPISAVGRLLLQARRSGTRCQTISVIRRLAKTLLGDY